MKNQFKDKIVFITGGARGIGKGTAEVFSERGAKLAISDLDGEELKKLGILEADVIFISSKSLSVNARLGKLEGTEQSEAADLGLRVIKDGKQLTISTTEISKESLIELAKKNEYNKIVKNLDILNI